MGIDHEPNATAGLPMSRAGKRISRPAVADGRVKARTIEIQTGQRRAEEANVACFVVGRRRGARRSAVASGGSEILTSHFVIGQCPDLLLDSIGTAFWQLSCGRGPFVARAAAASARAGASCLALERSESCCGST